MAEENKRRVLAEGKYVRLVARGRWEWAERTNTSGAVGTEDMAFFLRKSDVSYTSTTCGWQARLPAGTRLGVKRVARSPTLLHRPVQLGARDEMVLDGLAVLEVELECSAGQVAGSARGVVIGSKRLGQFANADPTGGVGHVAS